MGWLIGPYSLVSKTKGMEPIISNNFSGPKT